MTRHQHVQRLRSRRTGVGVAVLATVAVLALAGCGGSSGGTSDGKTTTATPSTSTSPTATTSATPTWTKTKASSRQFAVHFLNVLLDAYQKRDMTAANALADPATCNSCKSSQKIIDKAIAGKYNDKYSGPIKVTKTMSFANRPGGIYDVLVVFNTPAAKEVSDSGKVRADIDPVRGAKFEGLITWSGDSWQMHDYGLNLSGS